jgi:hypothetical protein
LLSKANETGTPIRRAGFVFAPGLTGQAVFTYSVLQVGLASELPARSVSDG